MKDQLTELFNRMLPGNALERAIQQNHRTGAPMAVVTLDLDHFKMLSNTLGHISPAAFEDLKVAQPSVRMSRGGSVVERQGFGMSFDRNHPRIVSRSHTGFHHGLRPSSCQDSFW